MNETRELIAGIVKNMDLNRKTRVTKKQKSAFTELREAVGAVNNKLAKLHLRLWNTEYKGDYHSLTLDEASSILNEVRREIDSILDRIPSSEL